MKKDISIKEIFENDCIIITNIMQGLEGMVRIDAKRRFHKPDSKNRFSEWCSRRYADKLAIEHYGKQLNDFSCYSF